MAIVVAIIAVVAPHAIAHAVEAPTGPIWTRHHISDRILDGSDGTKFGDLDGDGRLDVVTAFEGSGRTIAFRHPGQAAANRPWPAVAVGETPNAEDATFVDLDGDGALDVVTSTEKGTEQILVHWAPSEPTERWQAQAWTQMSIDAVRGLSMWMFAEPIVLQPAASTVLVVGGKNYERNGTAVLGLVIPGQDPRDAGQYQWRKLANVSWVMSIAVTDVNGDGFDDIIYSDKHGPDCGVWWLENPAATGNDPLTESWQRHPILHEGLEGCMLLDLVDVDQDGAKDIVVPVDLPREGLNPNETRRRVALLLRRDAAGLKWEHISVRLPEGTGGGKAATGGDVDGDGRIDLVISSTGATGSATGTYWLQYGQDIRETEWQAHNIAGPEGIKYDLVHLVDIDGDGDLDVITNDEQEQFPLPNVGSNIAPNSDEEEDGPGLGVIWYENPRLGSVTTAE